MTLEILRALYRIQTKAVFYLFHSIKYYEYLITKYSVTTNAEKKIISTISELAVIDDIPDDLFYDKFRDNCEFYRNVIKKMAEIIKAYKESLEYLKKFTLGPIDAADVNNVSRQRANIVNCMHDIIIAKIDYLKMTKLGANLDKLSDSSFSTISHSLNTCIDAKKSNELYNEAIIMSKNMEKTIKCYTDAMFI